MLEYCQENALIIANTLFQQHKRRLYTWTSPDGEHRNQIDLRVSTSLKCQQPERRVWVEGLLAEGLEYTKSQRQESAWPAMDSTHSSLTCGFVSYTSAKYVLGMILPS